MQPKDTNTNKQSQNEFKPIPNKDDNADRQGKKVGEKDQQNQSQRNPGQKSTY